MASTDLADTDLADTDLAATDSLLSDPNLQLVDVRNPSEHHAGTVVDARLIPLPLLLERIHELSPERPTVVFCASGNRSPIAASLLRARGFEAVADVLGGFDACVAAGMPVAHPQS